MSEKVKELVIQQTVPLTDPQDPWGLEFHPCQGFLVHPANLFLL